MIRLGEEFGAKIHIVHLASADAVALVAPSSHLTVETCPHYLTFAAEEIADGATAVQMRPADPRAGKSRAPLGRASTRAKSTWSRPITVPCPPAMKSGDFSTAWGGIASLQLSLAIMWNETQKRGIAPERLTRWMSAEPAKLAGLAHRKGAIAPGLDADLVVWNPGRAAARRTASPPQADPVSSAGYSRRCRSHISARPKDLRSRQFRLHPAWRDKT